MLHLRYVEARAAAEVERTLGLSTSQYYREHQAALEALAALLSDNAARGAARQTANLSPAPVDDRPRHNFPSQITSFIGRERELSVLEERLRTTRLLTLTGAGGSGKTRLAIELARRQFDRYPDGAWLVDFTPLSEPGLVAQTVAFTIGIRGAAAEPMLSSLIRGIRSKHLLLVLDNCEHVLDPCAQLIDGVLRACDEVTILVTSRQLVGITGEAVYQVPPFELPDHAQRGSPEQLAKSPAVQLFVERAALVANEFRMDQENANAIVRICERLDGLPLAIELAAARTNAFSPGQVAERLDDRFRLLTGGSRTAPRHHQTLRAMVDWSYELLNADERRLLQRMSVFAGGSTAEAIESVCAGDGLHSDSIAELLAMLVERSLVISEPVRGAMRYRMLETLREYACERLTEGGDAQAMRVRHGQYYAQFAEDCEKDLYGPRQVAMLDALELEHNNMRAVLSGGSSDPDAALRAARVAASLGLFWFAGNYFTEARHWCDWIVSLGIPPDDSSAIRCLCLDGFFTASLGEHVAGLRMCDAAIDAAQRANDASAVAWAWAFRCGSTFVTGDAVRTERDARAAIQACTDAGLAWGAAVCSAWLGRSLLMQRRVAESVAQLRVALEKTRIVGDALGTALSLSFYGAALGAEGDYGGAAACLDEALDQFRSVGCLAQISRVLVDWAILALSNDRVDDAANALAEGLAMTNRLGRVPYRLAQLLAGTAHVCAARHCWEDAARLLTWAQELRTRSGAQLPPERETEERELWQRIHSELAAPELAAIIADAHQFDESRAVGFAQTVLDRD